MSAELFRWLSTAGGFPGGLPVEVRDGLASEDVSPGVIGFLVTLALVLACIPLFRSMTGKLRGVQHRDPAGESGNDAGPGAAGPGAAGQGADGPGAAGQGAASPRADEQRPGAGVGTGSGSDA